MTDDKEVLPQMKWLNKRNWKDCTTTTTTTTTFTATITTATITTITTTTTTTTAAAVAHQLRVGAEVSLRY